MAFHKFSAQDAPERHEGLVDIEERIAGGGRGRFHGKLGSVNHTVRKRPGTHKPQAVLPDLAEVNVEKALFGADFERPGGIGDGR